VPAVLISFSGCLLTMGAPLARRVEPGKWALEGGAGLIDIGSAGTAGIAAYLYTGRALGNHFEIGILPYYYGNEVITDSSSNNSFNAAAIYVPLKWDPFNYDFPFHLTFNAGPALFLGSVEGTSVVLGLGLSYNLFDSLEIYSSLSSTQMVQLFTASLGMRYAVSRKLQAGALLMYIIRVYWQWKLQSELNLVNYPPINKTVKIRKKSKQPISLF